MKIENRTFIVSGGSSGLGLATATTLLSLGAYVSILDLSPPPHDLTPLTHRLYTQTDITSLPALEAFITATAAWALTTAAPLAGVINCAGIGTAAKIITSDGTPHDPALWDLTLAVNLTGSFNLTRLALPHILRAPPEPTPDAERGVIILVSSAAAFEGQPGQVAYAASKGALRSMALPLARDLARHAVRVVTIAPGVFASNMTAVFPDKTRRSLEREGVVYPPRFGRPEEFARTVQWVLECPYVNGETIRLSGGGRLPARL